MTTTAVPQECLSARNLSESWRLDHSGSDIKGGGPNAQSGWACDLRKDFGWFRFVGAAGKKALTLFKTKLAFLNILSRVKVTPYKKLTSTNFLFDCYQYGYYNNQ